MGVIPEVQPPVKLIVTLEIKPCVRSITGLHGASVRVIWALAGAKRPPRLQTMRKNRVPASCFRPRRTPHSRMIQSVTQPS